MTQTNWASFKSLCRIIGGRERSALATASAGNLLPKLVEMAAIEGMLPALAARIEENPEIKQTIGETEKRVLQQALLGNTRRNMQTVMQALKLTRTLNNIGISPTFLKGTAQLLTVNKSSLGFRKQVDIDFIVEPDALNDACEALLAAGYGFLHEAKTSGEKPTVFHDIDAAFRLSAAHHHLPALVIDGCATCVELHRHFLPKRFQQKNPQMPLINTSIQHQSHGVTFQVPSVEYRVIHIILGKMMNDGYLSRRQFPIREGCDYIALLDSVGGKIDQGFIEKQCGSSYAIFDQLVSALMAYKPGETNAITHRIHVMEKRYDSITIAKVLDAYARAIHLGNEIFYSPKKLPAYLQRQGHH